MSKSGRNPFGQYDFHKFLCIPSANKKVHLIDVNPTLIITPFGTRILSCGICFCYSWMRKQETADKSFEVETRPLLDASKDTSPALVVKFSMPIKLVLKICTKGSILESLCEDYDGSTHTLKWPVQ